MTTPPYELVEASGSTGKAPNKVAEEILEKHRFLTDPSNAVYRYEDGPWVEISDGFLRQLGLEFDGSKSSNHRRNEIIKYIQARTYRHRHEWGRLADHEIAVKNGILDLLSGTLHDHKADNYLERVIPIDYDPHALAPNWERAMIDWFGDGESDLQAEAVQEFFGYVCMVHAHYKTALMLYGPPDCGKSVIIMAAKLLAGKDYYCSLPVEHMDDPQRRSIIKGMALNTITELNSKALIADAGFKTLVSTEEPILLDRKYMMPETYIPTTKHIIATNLLPPMNERTEATFRRLLIVSMPDPISVERQDRELEAKLVTEEAGILAWAVAGAKRLYQRKGQFVTPYSTEILLNNYSEESNPVVQFLLEMAEQDERGATTLSVLAEYFNYWHSSSRKVDTRAMGQMLRQAGMESMIGNVRFQNHVYKSLKGYVLRTYEGMPPSLRLDGELSNRVTRSGYVSENEI